MLRSPAVLLLLMLASPNARAESDLAEAPRAAVRQQIETILEQQAADWNRGDLVGFTSIYADDATFISPSGVTRGRQEVLERYQMRYPDDAARGRLSFEILEVRVASLGNGPDDGVASLVARWRIAYEGKDDAEGLTLLVLHSSEDGWKIVQDASM